MTRTLAVLAVLAAPLACQAQISITDLGDGRVEFKDSGKTALVYNQGPQLKPGAPEDRRRCCYIFPVYTPSGVSMLDDFPTDHYHHHGLFWAWPVVETPQGKYDLWMYSGIQHRYDHFSQDIRLDRATHVAYNGWFAGEKKIVSETARITLFPAKGNSRTFEVDLTLEAVDQPVTLRGSPDKGKSYGGFSARFAPREATAMESAEGPVPKDEDLVLHQWAELTAVYGGKKAALRITPDPGNPGVPYQWCLRNYGFVGASFPGRTDAVQGHTLQAGKPLRLKFSVTVSDVD